MLIQMMTTPVIHSNVIPTTSCQFSSNYLDRSDGLFTFYLLFVWKHILNSYEVQDCHLSSIHLIFPPVTNMLPYGWNVPTTAMFTCNTKSKGPSSMLRCNRCYGLQPLLTTLWTMHFHVWDLAFKDLFWNISIQWNKMHSKLAVFLSPIIHSNLDQPI